jgi:hypothetical protein
VGRGVGRGVGFATRVGTGTGLGDGGSAAAGAVVEVGAGGSEAGGRLVAVGSGLGGKRDGAGVGVSAVGLGGIVELVGVDESARALPASRGDSPSASVQVMMTMNGQRNCVSMIQRETDATSAKAGVTLERTWYWIDGQLLS